MMIYDPNCKKYNPNPNFTILNIKIRSYLQIDDLLRIIQNKPYLFLINFQ